MEVVTYKDSWDANTHSYNHTMRRITTNSNNENKVLPISPIVQTKFTKSSA
jgi:hypothetical protein